MLISKLRRAVGRIVQKFHWRWRMRPVRAAAPSQDDEIVYIFIRCWNRPLHLWASLDSFFRNTRTPCRFVLIDNASDDPLVDEIILSFDRRGMFHSIHRMEENSPENMERVFAQHRPELGTFVVLADADVTVDAGDPDWLSRMVSVIRTRPKLGLLGTYVDLSDFVSASRAKQVAPDMPEALLMELIKARSPERNQPDAGTADLVNPYDPAGRLLLARTETLNMTGALIGNKRLCEAAVKAGYDVGITPRVEHRHLSLLNLFDYPEYDFGQLQQYLGKR